ncbi:unnamed protein product [Rhizophagus irregularis]|nr:unnamed protein product [Rhizophagus irregularis]CAB5309240.1 unnamed protein product [Rhizophagus irregularis]
MSVPEYLLAVSISFDEQFRDSILSDLHSPLTPLYCISLPRPILLKQKASEIKIKYINVNCDQNDCICKSKRFRKFEDNLKYAFLDPKDSN